MNVETKDLDKLLQLLFEYRDYDRENSLLHSVIRFKNFELFKLLIKFGANVNAQNYLNETPLHYVLNYGEENAFEMCKILLDKNADIFIKDYRDVSVLDKALYLNQREDYSKVIDLLKNKT